MLYYKVKPEADNKYINPSVHDENILIANELFTEKEAKRQNINMNFLTPVMVSKRKIYWFFGARFEM